jgi:hypothetical protein
MAHLLDDNTVVPSFMDIMARGWADTALPFTNVPLRIGEVKEIIYPGDERSQTKRFIEYSVEIQHRDSNGPGVSTMYNQCLVANLFGGASDIFRYTLRKDDGKDKTDDGVGVGSKVLVLCVNGETSRAVIIGGIRDPETDKTGKDKKSDGHNLYAEFNGISMAVDKDGQFKLQFRGATDARGDLVSDSLGTTSMEIQKNGNLEFYTEDQAQYMRLDHENKKASFKFDSLWEVEVGGEVTIKSEGVKLGDATDKNASGHHLQAGPEATPRGSQIRASAAPGRHQWRCRQCPGYRPGYRSLCLDDLSHRQL